MCQGFQTFVRIFASFYIGQISQQQHKGYNKHQDGFLRCTENLTLICIFVCIFNIFTTSLEEIGYKSMPHSLTCFYELVIITIIVVVKIKFLLYSGRMLYRSDSEGMPWILVQCFWNISKKWRNFHLVDLLRIFWIFYRFINNKILAGIKDR